MKAGTGATGKRNHPLTKGRVACKMSLLLSYRGFRESWPKASSYFRCFCVLHSLPQLPCFCFSGVQLFIPSPKWHCAPIILNWYSPVAICGWVAIGRTLTPFYIVVDLKKIKSHLTFWLAFSAAECSCWSYLQYLVTYGNIWVGILETEELK